MAYTIINQLQLDKAKKLKVISRFGVGYDNLDISYLKTKNQFFYNEFSSNLFLDQLRMIFFFENDLIIF